MSIAIQQNIMRQGSFTSSGIVALTKSGTRPMTDEELKANTTKRKTVDTDFGEAGLTYILETNIERMLDDTIDAEFDSKPTSWGTHLEQFVFGKLGLDYTSQTDVTIQHPTIEYLCGSPDGFHEDETERAVIDFKAPFTKKSFVQLVLPLYCGLTGFEAMNALRNGFTHNGFDYPKHKEGEKYYYQLVSNAIITGCDFAELIVYMPYTMDLAAIKLAADGIPSLYWMNFTDESAIPCIKDDGKFKDVNIYRFKIPAEDKELLTEKVLLAGKLLIPRIEK